MNNIDKKMLIINSAKELLETEGIQSISVSSIARNAGISKGSIYYYFESKEDIINAVFEYSYSSMIDNGKKLVNNPDINVFEKLKIMYYACLDAAKALHFQTEAYATYKEKQYIAYYYFQFTKSVVENSMPVLTEILKQGVDEGIIECDEPDTMAELILTTLTAILSNQLTQGDTRQIVNKLKTFALMQEKSMNLPEGTMSFIYEKIPRVPLE